MCFDPPRPPTQCEGFGGVPVHYEQAVSSSGVGEGFGGVPVHYGQAVSGGGGENRGA